MSRETILEVARRYSAQGLNVIPLQSKSKQPAVDWKVYQTSRFADFDRFSEASNIGVVCGAISNNLVVLDFEDMETFEKWFPDEDKRDKLLRETLVVRSGSGRGIHVYLFNDSAVKTRRGHEEGIIDMDVQGEGTIVVMPPSIHPSGGQYEIISETTNIMSVRGLEATVMERFAEFGLRKSGITVPQAIKGVKEGSRHTAALKIANFLIHVSKLDSTSTLSMLKVWAEKCDPPYTDLRDLERVVEDAVNYSPGGQTPLEPIPDIVRKEAERILEAPSPLLELRRVLDHVIVREIRNKLYVFIVLLSGLRNDAGEKQIVVLKGEPGGGKSHLANVLTGPFKTKKIARFSEHGLDYSNLSNFNILYIQEMLGLENDQKMGISTVRFLSGDDQGYTIEVAAKDPETGQMGTVQRTIPSMSMITTSTVVHLERQFERRTHIINVDESADTTREVIHYKAQRESEKLQVLTGEKKPLRTDLLLRALIELLQDSDIIVTTAETLGEILDTKVLRARGDYDKVLVLTKLIALLHYRQRPYALVGGRRVIFTLPQDAYYALQIGRDPILSMATGLEKRLRDVLPELEKLRSFETIFRTRSTTENVSGFTASDLAEHIGVGDKRALQLLHAFEEQGIVNVSSTHGRTYIWKVRISPEEMELKLKAKEIFDVSPELRAKLENEARNYFAQNKQLAVPAGALRIIPEDWFDRPTGTLTDYTVEARDWSVFRNPIAKYELWDFDSTPEAEDRLKDIVTGSWKAEALKGYEEARDRLRKEFIGNGPRSEDGLWHSVKQLDWTYSKIKNLQAKSGRGQDDTSEDKFMLGLTLFLVDMALRELDPYSWPPTLNMVTTSHTRLRKALAYLRGAFQLFDANYLSVSLEVEAIPNKEYNMRTPTIWKELRDAVVGIGAYLRREDQIP